MTELFDTLEFYGKPMTQAAAVRCAIGDVAEMFACRLLGATRTPIDGRKNICSDAVLDGTPMEIKSVGKNGRALIYKWRLEKEIEAHGPTYQYVFVRHDCRVTEVHGRDVVRYFLDHPPMVLVTTIEHIQQTLAGVEPRKFSMFLTSPSKRVGYHRKGYCDGGWQFSLAQIPVNGENLVPMLWLGQQIEVLVRRS